MPLLARQSDLSTAITDLKTCIANCDTDIQAQDVDTFAIQIREEASAALGALGFNSQEPK